MIKLDSVRLRELISESLLKIEVNLESVRHVSNSMVETSLNGVDSHGVNLFPHYYRAFQGGRLNKEPNFVFQTALTAAHVLDANHAIGHHSGIVAMKKCIETATQSGVGICAVKNSSHYGASSYFGLHAARQEFIGLAFTNADALVKSHNGKKSFFGTNPICFCMPLKSEEPLCLDMATSHVSWNKIKNYRRNNMSLEEEWAFDEDGQMVVDANKARSLSPSGAYKGFGLGMMIEILCSGLTSSVIAKDMMPMFNTPLNEPRQVSHFFAAINLEAFGDKNAIIESVTNMTNRLRNEEPLGEQCVMAPGDPQKKERKNRIISGIPCDLDVIEAFIKIDKRFSECVIESS